MGDDLHGMPLVRTKLHRPPVPADLVPRPELLELLERAPGRPAVLVSAPAGYGKSTLVAWWLEECGRPGAWLSLDEHDNDLQRFLSHFVTAVRTLFPEAAGDTMALLGPPALPPEPVVAATLVNELDRIDEDYLLVLDDVHRIREQAVHGFLHLILRQPPRCLQLVLVGRRDPILPIVSLRAKGMLTELRMADLRFSSDQATAFLRAALGEGIGESTAGELAEKAEGWVTGLRLAVLALRGTEDPGRKLLELKGTARYVVDYLVSEVLDRQPAGIRDFLVGTSILRRFCAPLCEATLGTTAAAAVDGRAFIDWLWRRDLFVVPLDTDNRWFRYHHLFGELLRARLQRTASPEEIAALHSRAGAWCEEQGLIEDAIRHALAAGDADAAAGAVERRRDAEFDANRGHVVGRWLNLLPAEVRHDRPRLLLAEARILDHRLRPQDLPPLLERVEDLFEDQPGEPLDQGELLYFQGYLRFWQGDGRGSLSCLERACDLVPESHPGYLRAQLELYLGLAAHVDGRTKEAADRLAGWRDGRRRAGGAQTLGVRTGMQWERLTFGLAALHLLRGELAPVQRYGQALLDDARRTGSRYIETWAEYLLGVVAFHRHDLAGARRHFEPVLRNRYVAHMRAAVDSMAGLAVAAQLAGDPEAAGESLRRAHDYARWTEDAANVEVVLACEARIALLRGDLDAAARWQRGFSLAPQVPGMIFFLAQPSITECQVLAALGTDAGLERAAAGLRRLRRETSALHYGCQTIEVLALEAMVADLRGRPERALDLVARAVDLAGPEDWLRPFVEPGPPVAGLLRRLLERDPARQPVAKILAAFPDHRPAPAGPQPPSAAPAEPLTHRELDVLELLARRLQNKEIARALGISPITVKAHLRSVYQKLGVARRREAVERAAALGLLE